LTQRRRHSRQEVDCRFYAIVTDLVGTPTELVDEAGAVAWQARSTLWGVSEQGGDGTVDMPLRFPGQYHDPETGWDYNYQRHYDPAIGRYTTPDPLGLEPDPNPYGYVDNPYSWIDPLGLLSCTGRLDKLSPGEMYLYRAVMDGELGQIMRTRTFQNPQGIETKYFSTTAEAAASYAREMYSRFPHEGAYTLVRSTIRRDAVPDISRVDLVEAGGIEALALPTEVLAQMGRIRILPGMPIP
jgi:RHS repeat-associated protein